MKLNWMFKRLFRRSDNAGRITEVADGGQLDDGCGVHRFASEREQAVSACRRVGLLASTLQAQRGRASDCSARDKVRELIGIAKSVGLWVDKAMIPSFGDLVSKRTGESAVYWNHDEGVFYKVKNPDAKRPIKHTGDTDWIYEHVIHNILFPECAYELVGVTEEYGEIRVVLRQRAIRTETFPSKEQIETVLAAKGFRSEGKYFYGDGVVSVTDVGEHGDNVLLGDDGRVYFIDPLIRLNRSAEDVIEWLTGFNPAKDGELTKGYQWY